MDLTELTVKLLLLFFPGIICFLLVDALVVHRERKLHEIFLLSFVYGILSYLLYAITAAGWSRSWPPDVSIFTSLADKDTAINIADVLFASAVATGLGIAVSVLLNHYWLHDIARSLKITRKFGQANVWSFALNNADVKWATVRD